MKHFSLALPLCITSTTGTSGSTLKSKQPLCFKQSKHVVSLNFGLLEVAQVPRGCKKFREVRRIHFHLSWYLSDAVVPSYVHLRA